MPIKALVRLALVCLLTGIIAKPHPAPINKQVHVSASPPQTVVQNQTHVPQPEKAAAAQPVAEKQKEEPKQTERPVEQPKPVVQALPPSKTDLMRLAGIPESDWQATDYIVSKESSWNHLAVNRSSGATGLCQALPASKMASVAGDYLTNPVTQLRWCHSYAHSRYGSWWQAFAFWRSNKWW